MDGYHGYCLVARDMRVFVGRLQEHPISTLIKADEFNNTKIGFERDVKDLTHVLKRNCFPAHVIDTSVNRYLKSKD